MLLVTYYSIHIDELIPFIICFSRAHWARVCIKLIYQIVHEVI